MAQQQRLTNWLTSQSLIPIPKLVPLYACPCRPSSPSQSHRSISSSNLTFFFTKPKPLLRFTRRTASPRAVAQPEPEQRLPHPNPQKEDLLLKSQQQVSQFRNRVVFGLGIGITVGGVVLAGGWVFTVALAAAVFAGAREYFELVRSHGITEGMTPPPRYVSRVCSVICALMPLFIMKMKSKAPLHSLSANRLSTYEIGFLEEATVFDTGNSLLRVPLPFTELP